MRSVFFISDLTGITAEALGNILLTHFGDIEFTRDNLAYIDSLEKAEKAAMKIKVASKADGQPALIFSTQIKNECRQVLEHCGGVVFDFLETFISKMVYTCGENSAHAAGL